MLNYDGDQHHEEFSDGNSPAAKQDEEEMVHSEPKKPSKGSPRGHSKSEAADSVNVAPVVDSPTSHHAHVVQETPDAEMLHEERTEREIQDHVDSPAKKKKKADKNKYYQNFEFFFKRSVFRTMTEFYKDKFNAFFEKRQNQLKADNPAQW